MSTNICTQTADALFFKIVLDDRCSRQRTFVLFPLNVCRESYSKSPRLSSSLSFDSYKNPVRFLVRFYARLYVVVCNEASSEVTLRSHGTDNGTFGLHRTSHNFSSQISNQRYSTIRRSKTRKLEVGSDTHAADLISTHSESTFLGITESR